MGQTGNQKCQASNRDVFLDQEKNPFFYWLDGA